MKLRSGKVVDDGKPREKREAWTIPRYDHAGVVEEDVIVYKKAYFKADGIVRHCCVHLLWPKGTKYVANHGGDSDKMRAARAEVLKVETFDGIPLQTARSMYAWYFQYTPGEIVTPTIEFDDDASKACASGIHAFRTIAEARRW